MTILTQTPLLGEFRNETAKMIRGMGEAAEARRKELEEEKEKKDNERR